MEKNSLLKKKKKKLCYRKKRMYKDFIFNLVNKYFIELNLKFRVKKI